MSKASSVYIDRRKWDERQHYHFDAVRMGVDEHGVWLGIRQGTPFDGPHGRHVYPASFVVLAPPERWWLASWWDLRVEALNCSVYVDIATPCDWITPNHLRTVDLDLDVIQDRDGRVYVDDEDEFEAHRVEYAYPDDVVRNARAACDEVLGLMRTGAEPFGSVGPGWLELIVQGTDAQPPT